MKKLRVNLSEERSYDILIERGLIGSAGERIKEIYDGKRIAVITDSTVKTLYSDTLASSLKEAGFEVKVIDFPAGEPSKNMDTVIDLYDELLNPVPFAMTRGDLIIALGGGVTGDMAGFVAATLLRGIPFVQIPTTLLAQVDSSVGGKVAVDLKQGKNLAGVFYQPKLVLIDPDTLNTLSDRIFADGLAEVIKYGMIRDKKLFETIEKAKSRANLLPFMEDIIYTCCDIKREIVENDEFDTGERMFLNFGHTLGHVFEKLGNYSLYMHGEAVSCGMVAMLKIGEKLSLTEKGNAERLENLLVSYALPVKPGNVSSQAVTETLAYDKKGIGDDITAVFCEKPGESFLKKISKKELAKLYDEIL